MQEETPLQEPCDQQLPCLGRMSSIKHPEIPQSPNVTQQVFVAESYSKNGKKFINEYEIIGTLGEGSYGKVKKVERTYVDENNNQCKSCYAMKMYERHVLENKRFFGPEGDIINGTEVIQNELNIIKTINHKNIARCYQIIDDLYHQKLYIVMEYCELGQLMDWSEIADNYVRNKAILEYLTLQYETSDIQTLTKIIFRQICEGVQYMHHNNITNRDIKVDNIMCRKEEKGYQIKIIDFSTARYATNDLSHQPAGTAGFRGPEHQFAVQQGYSPKACDVWSVGICLYLFYFGSLPFKGQSELQIDIKSKNDILQFPEGSPSDLVEIIMMMTMKNWKERATIDEVLEHPWLKI